MSRWSDGRGTDAVSTVDAAPDLAGELSAAHGAADSVERLLAHAVSAPAVVGALATGTLVAGRYVIERVLGAGGMGTVYLARDRSLARAVALKVHHTLALTDRLHREAVAMAKLAHPNVVTVFEIGEHDHRPFVAMEYVSGWSLREWMRSRAPSPAAILAALAAAGEGLAAAHAAGLVHRDVKPDNILVGADGRVRVGDFGLAQLGRGTDAALPAVLATSATLTGAVVGTPAYLAPEQIDGGEVDARTDQFAFCVTAWEALCGARPFDGRTTAELRAAILAGPPAPPRRRLSAPVRRVLARGLAADRAARWPSMPALLAALRTALGRRRRLALVGAGALAAGALAAWRLWPTADPAAACATAGDELAQIVPAGAVDRAIAATGRGGRANAAREGATIRTFVDQFRASEHELVQTACVLGAKGQWTAAMSDATRECAALRARTLRELLAIAPTAATQPSDVLPILARAPSLRACADPRVVASWRWLEPGTPATDATLQARAQLDAAAVLVELGQQSYARTVRDDRAVAALAATNADVARRLTFLDATLALAAGDFPRAETGFTSVYDDARGAEDADLVLAAATQLIDLAGRIRHDAAATDRWVREGLIEAQRDQLDMPARAIALVTTAAAALDARGDHARALSVCALVEKALSPTDPRRTDLLAVRARALAGADQLPAAIALAGEIVEAVRAAEGPNHPRVAEALAAQASFLFDADRTEEGLAAVRAGAAILEANPDDEGSSVASAAFDLGVAMLKFGDPGAERELRRARAIWVAAHGERHPDVALVDTNLALLVLDRGDVAGALALLQSATQIQERALGPDHVELAAGLYNLAVAQRMAHQLPAALATSQRCAAILAAHEPGSARHVAALLHAAAVQNLLGAHADALTTLAAARALPARDAASEAWAELETARALLGVHREPARARAALAHARALFTQQDLVTRVAEVDAVIATLPGADRAPAE